MPPRKAPSSPERRIWAAAREVWIFPEPKRTEYRLGYIRAGQSLALVTGEPVQGRGCDGPYYEVEPRGFVCNDSRALLKPDRYVKAMQQTLALPGPLPFRYALSNGAPMYRRLPSKEEWQRVERYYGKAGSFEELSWGNRGHEALAESSAIQPKQGIPAFLRAGGSKLKPREKRLFQRTIPPGSMLAFTQAFEHEGRTFLLSADGTVVPADRVRPYRVSSFRGLDLTGPLKLPIAWVREQPTKPYRQLPDGSLGEAVRPFSVRTYVALDTGSPAADFAGETFIRTQARDRGGHALWLNEREVTLVRTVDDLPPGVSEADKWIHVRLAEGTLVAYEGRTPVFATLVSPGAGGIPMKGRDPVKWSTTPLGTYRITFKHKHAEMSPDKDRARDERRWWFDEVPYTQYFNPPFAIHVAYWHENFGLPMSGGCVNVSPHDGRWLFDWTDPPLPAGWTGVWAGRKNPKGTLVVIDR